MKNKQMTVLIFAIASIFSMPLVVQADSLSVEQEKIIQQYLGELPADQVEQVRHNPSARLQFLRSIASSMNEEERAAFRNSWKSMSTKERQQALLKL